MKKSIKNTIMIGMTAVLIGTSAVTYAYANTPSGIQKMPENSFSQQMPDFRDGGKTDNFKKDGNAQNRQQPQDNNQKQAPQQNGDNSQSPDSQQPPQQSGENNQNSPSLPQDENSTTNQNTPAENGDSANSTDTALTDNSAEFEALATNFGKGGMERHNNFGLKSILCYAFLAVQFAIILLMIIYLFLSKFNKLSFNQVFPEKNSQVISQ